ncbi:MAG: aminotransferase class IV [Alistipes sp.]|nr:aminotransferase class IV [Alistipes sp.]
MSQQCEKYMILNGELCTEQASSMPFVYQNIHSLGYSCRHIAQHIELLNQSAKKLFDTELDIDSRELERQASMLLQANRLSRNATIGIELSLDADGNHRLRCHGNSIYQGYVMRSLRPEIATLPMSNPLGDYPTSASIEAQALANAIARRRGYHSAIMIGPKGEIKSDSANPIFTIKGYTLYSQTSNLASVERTLVERAAMKVGYGVQRMQLSALELESADEVLLGSYQGISAAAHIDNRPYMSIAAERIAAAMEQIYNSKK